MFRKSVPLKKPPIRTTSRSWTAKLLTSIRSANTFWTGKSKPIPSLQIITYPRLIRIESPLRLSLLKKNSRKKKKISKSKKRLKPRLRRRGSRRKKKRQEESKKRRSKPKQRPSKRPKMKPRPPNSNRNCKNKKNKGWPSWQRRSERPKSEVKLETGQYPMISCQFQAKVKGILMILK